MIPVEEALEIVMGSCVALPDEAVPLVEALDRFLAEDAVSRDTIPAAPTSAMDGYAVRSSDFDGDAATFTCVGEIPAGTPPPAPLEPGQTMKIFTGSLLPEGADAVVMVERSSAEGDAVTLTGGARPQQHVRPPGEVIAAGDVAFPAGVRLGPGHLAVLATLGYAAPRCARRPRVAILPTGSELVAVDQPLAPGQVRDSNSIALDAQVRRAGGIPVRLPPAADDVETLRQAVSDALDSCDVLITSGGVSMGDYDFVGEVLDALGCQTHFTRVRTKPGKPVTFATRGDTQVFGLPGNPVSSMVSFELFCRPALRARMGSLAPHRPRVEARLAGPVKKAAGRRDFQRATLEFTEGGYQARSTGPQGSGIILSMAAAQALMVLDDDATRFEAGQAVPAVLLDEALEGATS